MKTRYILYAALAAFVVIGGVLVMSRFAAAPQAASVQEVGLRTVQLRGQSIRVLVADTGASREKGLSGRSGLAADEGMLFVFPQDGKYAFWMKDMLFSIDILWLSGDGAVVYMAENVSPDTYPQNFQPLVSARYVLELPAGYAKEYNVVVGDLVRF